MSKLKNTFIFRLVAVVLSVMILFTTYSSAIVSISAVSTESEPVSVDSDYTITLLTDDANTVYLYYWQNGQDGSFYNGTSTKLQAEKDGKTLTLWEYAVPSATDNCIFTTINSWGSDDSYNNSHKLSGDLRIPKDGSANQFYYEAIGGVTTENGDLLKYSDISVAFSGEVNYECAVNQSTKIADFSDFSVTGTLASYITSYEFYEGTNLLEVISADNTAFNYMPAESGVHTLTAKARDIFGILYESSVTFTVTARTDRAGFVFANNTVSVNYGTEDCDNLTVQALQNSYSDVTYSSSDTSVAEINGNKITVKKAGTTDITAYAAQTDDYFESSASYTLDVKSGSLDSVSFENSGTYTHTYNANKNKFTNKLKNLPEGAKVEYSSSNPDIASVDENSGEVTVLKTSNGAEVTISAQIKADNYSDITKSYKLNVLSGEIVVENKNDTITYSENKMYECVIDTTNLPSGYEITYALNSGSDVAEFTEPSNNKCNTLKIKKSGEFQVIATVTAPNYAEKAVNITVNVNLGDYAEDKGFSFADDFKNENNEFIYKFTYGTNGNNIQLALDKSYDEERIEYTSSDDSIASVTNAGLVTVKKSGTVTIIAKRPQDNCYKAATTTLELDIEKGERPDWSYSASDNKAIYYGQSLEVETPTEIDLSKVSYTCEATSVKFDDEQRNKLTPTEIGSFIIQVTAEEDDCYKTKTASFELKVDYLPVDTGCYSLTGDKVTIDANQFNSNVTIKPEAGYQIALYNENCNYLEYTDWKDSIVLDSNVANPSFVFISVAENETKGAISSEITTDITIDKSAPSGRINVSGNYFNQLLDTITFGIFNLDTWTVTIESWNNEDSFNSEIDIKYYVAKFTDSAPTTMLTEDDIKEYTADGSIVWTEYNEPFTLNDGNNIVYACLYDEYGNESFISTNSIVVDTQKPTFDAKIETEKNDFGYYDSDIELSIYNISDADFSSGISSIKYVFFTKNDAGEREDLYLNYAFENDNFDSKINPEKSYTVNIPFGSIHSESVYYEVEITDFCGQSSVFTSEESFNVSSKPEISMNFDSGMSLEEYYTRDVLINIAITQDDYTFDEGLADKLVNNIFDDYEGVSFSEGWSVDGNNHKKTITLSKDNYYQLSNVLNNGEFTYQGSLITGESEENYNFTIDTSAPLVTIKFDNNKYVLNDNIAYFKEKRVATITVEDDNFEGMSDMVSVTAQDVTEANLETVPQIVWNGKVGTIKFTEDAHYTLAINDKFIDKAEHSAQVKVDDDTEYVYEFVIDKTAPVVTIKYNNNISDVGGYYYQSNRVATITVDDVNFKGETDMVSVTAKDVTEADLTVPQIVWNGDVGTIVFTEDAHYTLKITEAFVDKAGTKAVVTVDDSTKDAYAFAIDKVNPENLKIEYKSQKDSLIGTIQDLISKVTNGYIYFSDDIEVTVSATDNTAGIERIEYSAPLLEGSTEVGPKGVDSTTVNNENETVNSFSTTFTVPAEYKGTIKATAYDGAGRSTSSDEENGVVVSKKKPEITLEVLNPTYAVVHDGDSYFNEDVNIKVTVEDVFFDSSKVVVTETTDGNSANVTINADSWTRKEGTNQYETTVTLSSEGVKTLNVEYTNNSGHSADSKLIENIVIDKDAPAVTIEYNNNTSDVGGYYYQAKRVATITVDDANFKGETDMVSVTAKDVTEADLTVPQIVWNGNVGEIEFNEDAHYTLTIADKFVDKAGTKAKVIVDNGTEDAYAFAIDKVNPENLKIEYKSQKDSLIGTIQDLISKVTNGYIYFSDDIEVTVSATDNTAGVERIEYSAPLLEGSTEVGTNGVDSTTVNNEKESVNSFSTTFTVPAEYKGKIQATAYDRAGRSTSSAEKHGVVVSNKKPEITLEVLNPTYAVIHDEISYYNEDVKIKVTVEDVFFDSSKVIVTETTDGNNANVTVNADSWTRKEGTNQYETTVTLSSEGVKTLNVEYTNNSGHSADSKLIENIVIDKTAPVVTIKYNNNISDVGGYYYQSNRVATITVDDVNFKGETDMVSITAKDVTEADLTVPQIVWNGNVGTIVFTEDAHYTLTITEAFVDKSGTKAIVTVADSTKDAYAFAIDKVNPENLKIEYKSQKDSLIGTIQDLISKVTNGYIYFSDDIEVTVSATDNTAGIERIEYSAPLLEGSTEVGTNGVDSTTVNNEKETVNSFSTTFTVPAEYKGTIKATAYDRAGRSTSSDEENGVVVSKKKPEITLEVLNPTDAVVHNGDSYFNEDVNIKVTVEDVFFDSSKVIVTETTDGNSSNVTINADSWTRKEGTNQYETIVTLSSEGVKTLNVEYTNNSGISANDKLAENIVIDKTAPVVTVKYDNNTSLVNGYYYNKARTATITVIDVNFEGEADMVKVTAVDKAGKSIKTVPGITWNGKVGTIKFTDDAYYKLSVTDKFVDKAGTKAEVSVVNGTKDAYGFVVDKSNPDVGTISVKDQNSKEIDLSNKEQNHTQIIYSNMAVNVSITANDVLTKPSVEYFISSSYLECKNITDWETYTGSIKFEPDRKFVLYTKITDQAGNYIYRTTNIIILDKTNPEIDGIAPDIKLNPSSNQQKVDKNGNVLYNGDVKVDYVITDPIVNNSCAGLNLEKLTYKVVCDGKVTQNGKLNGTVTEYDGRVGSYKGTITVDSELNNSNNVQLIVDATDNATNHSDSKANLRIDITAPTINVSWDKTSDADHTKYFKETRTATITIRERNFDADDVVVTMTKDGDEYSPSLSWIHTGTAETDAYSHIAEINVNSDGDYTFDISYVDEATNKAGEVNYGSSVSPKEFTIDLIRPEITVDFDNNSAQNGNYYNNHRTATITVNEHNFDPSRFEYSCVATDDGATVSAPELGSWTSSGDVHTAIVNFNSDAKFTLEVSGRDMANNEVDASQKFEFYVDTTAPEITLNGIKYQSANNGKDGNIGFTLTATDTNINTGTFTPEFKRVDINGNNENVYSLGTETNINNGVTYSVENIADDGIYTISCEVVDMAGNVTSKSIVEDEEGKKLEEAVTLFSVNREGSTFMLDENTQKIVDLGYIQNVENDVVITEINPDNVGKYVVTLEKDAGKEKVLSIGENYTRKADDSTGTWKTYTYTVKANNFEEEASYNLAVTTTDTAENTSYSETKNPSYTEATSAKVNFVVDRTIPEVVVTNIESNARYNVDKQTVNIVANDDNLLNSVKIILNGDVVKEYNEEELVKNKGKITLDINSLQSHQNLEIIAVDAAENSTNDSDETEVAFTNFLVTTNFWIQFINNPVAIIISASAIVLLTALIIFIIAKKKSKKDEDE